MGEATLAARALLALLFATAAIAKLTDPATFLATIRDFGASRRVARLGAAALPPAELMISVGLLIRPTDRWAAAGASLLLVLFIVGIANALGRGLTPDCGCFGSLRATPIGRSTLLRNAALLLVSVFAAFAAPRPAVAGWIASRGPLQLVLSLLVIALLAIGLVIYRPSAVRNRVTEQSPSNGSPSLIGQQAISFALTDAQSKRQTLESISQPGLPLLLVFASATCAGCVSLFPYLGRWAGTLGERLQIALVVNADTEAAAKISDDHGLDHVLVDPDRRVVNEYGVRASPSAFVISADGRVANGPAIGQDQIESLIRLTLRRHEPIPSSWLQTTHAA